MHILVTLLGDPKLKEDGSYPETIYQFEDGNEAESSYIGLVLKKTLKPNKIVILGTTGSTWHSFIDYCFRKNPLIEKSNYRDLLSKLTSDYKQDCVSQVDLDIASEILSKYDQTDCQYMLTLVPYGRNQAEQTETLSIMMRNFEPHDEATIDVTYGLRHLPMLMQQSALLLQSIKNVKVHNIFYGAFHLAKNNKTPIMTLDGILEIDRWTKALHRYEQDGDYTAFQEPLKSEKINSTAINALKEAAYYERTFNLTEAGKKLSIVKQHLPNQFDGIGGFFTERFKEHIAWSNTLTLKQRQSELAHFYLDNGDFVRAAIFAVESFITSLLKREEFNRQQNFRTRNTAAKEFKSAYENHHRSERGDVVLFPSFEKLSRIRNALAHGTEPSTDIADLMKNQEKLAICLNDLFNKLGIKA